MKSVRILFASVILFAFATPALAEIIPLAAISAYFNAMKTAEAGFTQVNEDGSKISGQIFIRRPGRIRFEYDPPEDTLVLAFGGQVAVFDSKSNQPPQRFPLRKTPLNLILARKVDMGRADMVVSHTEDGILTLVEMQDPDRPEFGTILLAFTDNPVALRQWVVTDGSGQRTSVVLDDFKLGGTYRANLFSIRREMARRGF